MLQVENMKSTRTGESVADQFFITVDSAVGHIHMFRSYKTPCAFIVYTENGRYFVETSETYSRTTTKYQNIFKKKFLGDFPQYKVDNFLDWVDALSFPVKFNDLLLSERM